MSIVRITFLTLLVASCFGTLEVYSPNSVRETFKESITYTVANFGHIPFGKTLVGPLIVVKPQEACDFDKIEAIVTSQNPFLLIKRGGCNFVKKVENAEKLGAKMAIIMDNVPENSAYLTMKDDGSGYRVKIPSILINIQDGNQLINQSSIQPISLKITFDTLKTDKVDLTLWLQSNNRMSYRLVREFAEDYQKIKDHVNLRVVHHTITCYFCRELDCYSNGKYCSINHQMESLATGRDIIKQQLRTYPSKWWEYMNKYDLECDSFIEAPKCNAKLFEKMDINTTKIEWEVDENLKNFNILDENKEILDVGGITSFPAASINSIRVPGNLKGTYLLEEICTTLKNPPIECASVIDMPSQNPNPAEQPASNYQPNYGFTIALVVFIVTIFFVVAFCLYKRCLARQITTEMTSQVNDMVSKYIEFYSERANH